MPNKKKPQIKSIIQRCGCDLFVPLAAVYMLYVILHGHLSPGGGFQGGVLMVAIVAFIYFGHGYDAAEGSLKPALLRRVEGLALIAYVVIAFLGVFLGAKFCENFAFNNGAIGDLISSGTISWMDEAVGVNVMTGVAVLSLTLLGLLKGIGKNNKQ